MRCSKSTLVAIATLAACSAITGAVAQAHEEIEAEIYCQAGQIIALRMEVRTPGTITLRIPPNVCAAATQPQQGPPPVRRGRWDT